MCDNLSLSLLFQSNKPTKNSLYMLMNLLICGSNFQSEERDDDPPSMSSNSSPSSTPRRSRVFCRSGGNNSSSSRDKNPYASRGLDKFSALLADLDEKRRKIYAANGSDSDISFVRFVYKDTNDLVPVVVKLKDGNQNAKSNDKVKKEAMTKTGTKSFNNVVAEEVAEIQSSPDRTREKINEKVKKPGLMWRSIVELDKLSRPSYYLPIAVIMILLLLSFFGRSVTILCTSIGWYVVPALNESILAKKRISAATAVKTKKDYVKKVSEKRMVSEGFVSSPRLNSKSPTRQDHHKNWC